MIFYYLYDYSLYYLVFYVTEKFYDTTVLRRCNIYNFSIIIYQNSYRISESSIWRYFTTNVTLYVSQQRTNRRFNFYFNHVKDKERKNLSFLFGDIKKKRRKNSGHFREKTMHIKQ